MSVTKERRLKLVFSAFFAFIALLFSFTGGIFGSLPTYIEAIPYIFIAICPLLLVVGAFTKRYSVGFLVIFTVSFGVLLMGSLSSPYLWGWDIHFLVRSGSLISFNNGHLPLSANEHTVSLLTTSFLSYFYSGLLGLRMSIVFKFIYPILYSFVPVGTLLISRRLYGDYDYVISTPFIVMFFYWYFKKIPGKQAIAELFLVLLIYLISSKRFDDSRFRFVAIMFLIGLIFSHYGVSLIFIILGISGVIILLFAKGFGLSVNFHPKPMVSLFLLGGVCWLVWYSFAAGGLTIELFSEVIIEQVENLITGKSSGDRTGVGYMAYLSKGPIWAGYTFASATLVVAVLFGNLYLFYISLKRKSLDLYNILSVMMVTFIVVGTILSFNLGFDRVFGMFLAALAPASLYFLSRRISSKSAPIVASVFMLALFLLSSGVLFTAFGVDAPRYAVYFDSDAPWHTYTDQDLRGAWWLDYVEDEEVFSLNRGSVIKGRDALLVYGMFPSKNLELVHLGQSEIRDGGIFYVSDSPVIDKFRENYLKLSDLPIGNSVIKASKLYSNGENRVLLY